MHPVKVLFSLVGAVVLSFAAMAYRDINCSPLSRSGFPDTEISTNILFNARKLRTEIFEVGWFMESITSNNFQVAFGTDANKDGVLSFEETGLVVGWKNDRYFIEDVLGGVRYDGLPDTEREWREHFLLRMSIDKKGKPSAFAVTLDDAPFFSELSRYCPSWLYSREWDILKITRRGAGKPSEWALMRWDFKYTYIIVK